MTLTTGAEAFRRARDFLLDHGDDGQAARSGFEWPDVGDHFVWARDWFDAMAEGNDDIGLWIVEDDGREAKYTFDDLRRRSNRLARWLTDQGLTRGDVVMLMLPNRVELWVAMLAVMKLGGIVLPTSVVLGEGELQDRIDRADVRAVIAEPEDAAKFADVTGDYVGVVVPSAAPGGRSSAPPAGWTPIAGADAASDAPIEAEVRTADTALIYFTSGTTSKPKIVEHSHASYPVGMLTTMYWIGVRPGDTHLVISSPGWGKHAWSAFFAPWHVGATVFVLNYAKFEAHRLVAELERAQVATFCAPPTVWRMLIQQRLDERPSALRELLSAGEPLNPEVIARIQEWWGLEIRDGYGQTETTALIANAPGDPVTAGAMGRPLPGVRVALVDPMTGVEAAEGEICLVLHGAKPLNLMTGYLANPEATARAFHDGWFHTGDVATIDDEGCITFVGRTDDIFKSSDFKVSPFEVESALVESPLVAEAAVVGAPDETRLNVTKAYIALAPGIESTAETAEAVLRHARSMPAYMRVRRIEFFELPKTASGKIRRVELRQREVDAVSAGERITTEWREDDFPDLKR